jgi:AmmeMemoRadiSam system protein A
MELLSQDEGLSLLKLARYALQASLGTLSFLPPIPPSSRLQESRGIFVGLWRGDLLRGCIGAVSPSKPLKDSVIEITLKSALQDARFGALCKEELKTLTLEISVLSAPTLIDDVTKITLGTHGLLILDKEKMGLLLPSLAIKMGWDRTTFLEQTCLKGGLPKDSWLQGAHIATFTTQSFTGSAQVSP